MRAGGNFELEFQKHGVPTTDTVGIPGINKGEGGGVRGGFINYCTCNSP